MPSIINATTTNGLSTSADNSGSLQLATNNGTTAVTIDTSQNVGIGTASPAVKCHVSSSAGVALRIDNPSSTSTGVQSFLNGNLTSAVDFSTSGTIFYQNAGSGACPERMRIDSSGRFLFNTSSSLLGSAGAQFVGNSTFSNAVLVQSFNGNNAFVITNQSGTSQYNAAQFCNNGTTFSGTGSISISGSSTAYNTSSDYRLKENIAPMTGALDKVAQLKPVTYTWKVDGSDGQGFIAHELQEVVPDCVTGEKDAVDEEGNPVHQGIDTSFLVATLTAAIQELKAELDATKAEVAALKGA